MKSRPIVALVHASRAAVDPVTNYFNRHAPHLDTVNLLDDGVMRMLAARDMQRALRRLDAMIQTAWTEYEPVAAILTCSALAPSAMEILRRRSPVITMKIDEPMAQAAVCQGTRIGVLASFPATVAATGDLLHALAPGPLRITSELAEEALRLLLAGDPGRHDLLLTEAFDRLAAHPLDAIVLAQVSMARLHETFQARTPIPVFSSLASCLQSVVNLIG